MTAQIQDAFLYDGARYALAGISEGELFDVTSLGLRPVMASTACWRGYQAVFGLEDRRLVLDALHINLIARDEAKGAATRAEGPELRGVRPTPATERFDFFNNHYEGLKLPIEYTGGVLLADGFIRSLYVHMGFHPAWKYERVVELVFDGGLLTAEHDRSAKMAEVRERVARSDREPATGEIPTRGEVEAFVERCFDRRYRR